MFSLLRSRCTGARWISRSDWKGNVGGVVSRQIFRRWFMSSSVSMSRKRPVLTLNPERLSFMNQPIFDLSHAGSASLFSHGESVLLTYFFEDLFPPDTKGFFHYHRPPGLPPVAGELRFRICDSVSEFAHGKDLEIGLGKPWHVTLHTIVQGPGYAGIRDLLLEEGLIDQELVADIEKLRRDHLRTQVICLYDIDQPFIVKLNSTRPVIRLVTRYSVRIITLELFSTYTNRSRNDIVNPYRGRLKARFELHPQASDPENPALALRFLERLTPVECVAPEWSWTMAEPRPGELLSRARRRPMLREPIPWTYSLGRPSRVAKMLREFLAERAMEKKKYGV